MKDYIYKTQTEYAQQHLRAAQKALTIPFPDIIEEK